MLDTLSCLPVLETNLCEAWSYTITVKTTTRAFSWLNVATAAFTFKNLWRHYANQSLTFMLGTQFYIYLLWIDARLA